MILTKIAVLISNAVAELLMFGAPDRDREFWAKSKADMRLLDSPDQQINVFVEQGT